MGTNENGGIGICVFAAAMAFGTGAVAQEAANQSEAATSLEEIVVTGGRSPQQISEIARTIYIVDSDQIQAEARSGKTLQQILGESIPSFDPASDGARTSVGQNLRGRPPLILIDGVSMNSARSVSRQFDAIDPFNIERVEVLSGATAIYGGNATGGIINIITKKGKDAEPGLHEGEGYRRARHLRRRGGCRKRHL